MSWLRPAGQRIDKVPVASSSQPICRLGRALPCNSHGPRRNPGVEHQLREASASEVIVIGLDEKPDVRSKLHIASDENRDNQGSPPNAALAAASSMAFRATASRDVQSPSMCSSTISLRPCHEATALRVPSIASEDRY